ncbi:MAG TPA: sugar phosphate isomerase/epimerase family protein [Chthonomonadaceae bacterium]|nr:sugar phosphate isomerase/epimerase family protein [Chthonomonadaceae bacterium]
MRFGVCAGIEAAPLLADAGYDYIELSVAGDLIPDEDDEAWAEKRRSIEAMPLRTEAFNSFVRAGKIVGPEADSERLRRYVSRALSRAEGVGGAVIVFGSGGARNIPEGFPREMARRQLIDFLRFCADASAKTGVIVAIEPLHRAETNFIHRVREGAEIARILGREGVRCLADTYHMEMEEEPLSAIVDSADVLAHAHTADTNRYAPGAGTYDHVAFFRALREAGYDLRVSIECNWQGRFADQIGPALAHLKAAHVKASSI